MAVDPRGNLYVVDSLSHVIRKVSPEGLVTTVAGVAGRAGDADGPGPTALFYSPSGIALDTSGNVYVTDCKHALVRKISTEGVVTTVLADSSGSASASGQPPTVSGVECANAIAVDWGGSLYVSVVGEKVGDQWHGQS